MKTLDTSLDEFLSKLPADYIYGARERVEVRQLLLGLLASNEWPGTPARLKTLLAPLICSSPSQQEEFYRRFEIWARQYNRPAGSIAGEAVAASQSDTPPSRPRVWRHVVIVTACLLALGAAAAWYVKRPRPVVRKQEIQVPQPSQPIRTGPEVLPSLKASGRVVGSDGNPVEGAEVWIPGQLSLANSKLG